jgi:hypothetical protein
MTSLAEARAVPQAFCRVVTRKSSAIRPIKMATGLAKNFADVFPEAQRKSAVGYQSNGAFVWALSASIVSSFSTCKFVVHQNCMKIKRPPGE